MKLNVVFLSVLGLVFSSTRITALEQEVKNREDFSGQDYKVYNNASFSVDCAMETEDSINKRVKKVTMEQLDVKETDITLTSRWVEDFGADSLDIVELVMAMEEEFQVGIPDTDAENILNIKDAIAYINNKRVATS